MDFADAQAQGSFEISGHHARRRHHPIRPAGNGDGCWLRSRISVTAAQRNHLVLIVTKALDWTTAKTAAAPMKQGIRVRDLLGEGLFTLVLPDNKVVSK